MSALTLLPHPQTPALPAVQLTGTAARRSDGLLISYALCGTLEDILLPEQAAAPSRRDTLWQQTCFELFAAPAGSCRYWEINLSPAGDWNIYAFSACRTGMREEPSVIALPFRLERQPASLRLELFVPLDALVAQTELIELGITAVLQSRSGQMSYWALTHCASKPDFHLRESFILRLPPA
ncbi:DOMON-like domain-containing protein [Candidatus Electronema sp. JM]|uniref:DOMON-like domain-containing protein n=1 Tax=Candidatus Electronema sp. JM TaxID=3401571 RepID=UPI003AA8D868